MSKYGIIGRIEELLSEAGYELKGALNIEMQSDNQVVIPVYDMSYSTFAREKVAYYFPGKDKLELR